MAVADDALAPVPGLELAMPAEKVRDLRLDRLSKQATRATAQDFGELIAESAWLNQFDDVGVDTPYQSFDGEGEASTTPRYAALLIKTVTNFRP